MPIHLKRIYEQPSEEDGTRILVERLWPRGISKEKAAIDFWSKDTAPSHALRKWFNHDPARWEEFKTRYFAELDENPGAVAELLSYAKEDKTTFVYASREEKMNNAVALKAYLEHHAK
ncbi:MAG: DUF488 family protein [Rubricoccaceae bacterium]|nr:DUF488 family protein [Rubricoccaceae bacterium]